MATAVVTRDPAEVQAYAAALAPLGLDVIAMPVTRTVPPTDADALSRAVREGGFSLVVVASQRAAHELAQAAAAGEALPPVWVVGPATERILHAAQIAARWPTGVRDVADLARHIVASQDVRGQRILVPRAEDGRTEGLEILRAAGAEVVDVVAYRTVPCAPDDAAIRDGADALASGGASVLCVFAPSQVTALATVLTARGLDLAALRAAACAIGETTAQALRQAGIGQVAVAPEPTPQGMARAAASVYPPKA